MNLSTRAIHAYRRSIKGWLGYVAENHWSNTFECPAVTVLGAMLDPINGQMGDFLQRYPRRQRTRREHEVRYVVLIWLAELAL